MDGVYVCVRAYTRVPVRVRASVHARACAGAANMRRLTCATPHPPSQS